MDEILQVFKQYFVPEDDLLDLEDESTMSILNGSNCFQINTVKHPRRSES
jgi:hypothetical protein